MTMTHTQTYDTMASTGMNFESAAADPLAAEGGGELSQDSPQENDGSGAGPEVDGGGVVEGAGAAVSFLEQGEEGGSKSTSQAETPRQWHQDLWAGAPDMENDE